MSPSPIARARRRGVVLILVLAILALMALIGVTFATFAAQGKNRIGGILAAITGPRPDACFQKSIIHNIVSKKAIYVIQWVRSRPEGESRSDATPVQGGISGRRARRSWSKSCFANCAPESMRRMYPVTVAASIKYMTASAMSLTMEGQPFGNRLSITSFGVFRRSGV